ncbi:MAG: beta-ketoacyl-ACP synthase II [Tenericutes bacterium]|nr:beta-ketoacyl-ACP synthase II [Mycoplasmatota bacterium]
MKRRVVITGLGAISPIGNDVPSMWSNAMAGVNGIDRITRYDASQDPVKFAGEIKNYNFEEKFDKKELKRMDRFIQLALLATEEAVNDSGIDFTDKDTSRCGVYYSSGIGGLETIATQEDRAQEKGYHRLSPFFIPSSIINLSAGNIAIKYGIHGSVISHVTACASSTNGIGEAFRAIRDDYLDLVIAGGSEACVIPLGIWGFAVMQALNKGDDKDYASIPFDENRSGFVFGEGAGTLILEEYEQAKARGAKIYAEVVGYGSTCDASHITGPDPVGAGARDCMLMAVKDAAIKPEDIDYINAHGTSTPLNDKTETMAIKAAFKEHAYKLNVSSTKSMTGHLLGATGAVEAIFIALATRDDFVPPTINTKTLDPLCDLNYTLGSGIKRKVNYAISNTLGFGGHNATIAIKKYVEEE